MSIASAPVSLPAVLDGKVRVFISYAHPDADIAQALFDALKDGNQSRVLCFLDAFTITSGDDWAKTIRNELRVSDWLIFIYHEGRSYEFCGFEIGTFTTIHDLDGDEKKTDARMFTIHDIDPLPSLLQFRQNRKVHYRNGEDDFDPERALLPDEVEFYANSPLGRFFAEFYEAPPGNPLFPIQDAVLDSPKFRRAIAKQARRVTLAFRKSRLNDLKFEKLFQHRLEIEISNDRFWERGEIPRNAVVTGNENTFSVIGYAGISGPDGTIQLSWGALSDHYAQDALVTPWLDAIEDEIIDVGKNRPPSGTSISFRSTHDSQIYRVILAREEGFHSGARKFYVQLIKTMERQFAGITQTSVLLAAIVMASRFYFYFLEEGDIADRLFSDDFDPDEFEGASRQLIYTIERMEHESSEFGITDPTSIVDVLGYEHKGAIEAHYRVWKEAKGQLFQTVRAGLAAETLPRQEIKAAVASFVSRLERHNKSFLSVCLDAYHKLMAGKIKRSTRATAPDDGESKI